METLIIIGGVLVILGIIGSIVPAMPGPFLSFVGLLLLFFAGGREAVSVGALILFGSLMVILSIIDYAAPILGAKFFGASRKGIWGAIIGGFLGIVFFPPLGIFLGALLGAVIGEMSTGKQLSEATRAGIGVIVGSVSVIILQTIFALAAAIYFFVKIV